MSSPTLDEGGQGLDGQDQWSQEEENAFLADDGKTSISSTTHRVTIITTNPQSCRGGSSGQTWAGLPHLGK